MAHTRVAVDFDDVVVEFFAGVIESVRQEYGVELAVTDNWSTQPLKQSHIFGEGRTWWDWLREHDWVWATYAPVDGAIGGITQLRQAGHYVEGLTSKPQWAEWVVWKWLGRWRVPFNSVTIVPEGADKSAFSDAAILIDDRDKNCLQWVDSCDDRFAILYDRPWNQRMIVSGEERIEVAHDWQDVVQLVAEFEENGGW